MKKIEGFITSAENGPGYELGLGEGYCDFWEGSERVFGKATSNNLATLIIHEGERERVYTESEVRAMLEDILGHAVLLGGSVKEKDHVHEEDIKEVAAKHGINL